LFREDRSSSVSAEEDAISIPLLFHEVIAHTPIFATDVPSLGIVIGVTWHFPSQFQDR
jgi:hypothetical protein